MQIDIAMGIFSIITFALGYVVGREHEWGRRRNWVGNDKRLIRKSRRRLW